MIDFEISAKEKLEVEEVIEINPPGNQLTSTVDDQMIKVVLEEILSRVSCQASYQLVKCQGYKPPVGDICTQLACSPLHDLALVIENQNLHTRSSAINNYKVQPERDEHDGVNKGCDDLKYSLKLEKIVRNGHKKYTEVTTMNNNYLSHNQLIEKVTKFQE